MNLERLKQTGLLVRGFEEFLVAWKGTPPVIWKSSTHTEGEPYGALRHLPDIVHEYNDLSKKWLPEKVNSIQPFYRPHVFGGFQPLIETEDTLVVSLINFNSAITGAIDVSSGQLVFQFEDWETTETRNEISEMPMDEFLVSVGLEQVVMSAPIIGSQVPDDAYHVFSGGLYRSIELDFYYSPQSKQLFMKEGDIVVMREKINVI